MGKSRIKDTKGFILETALTLFLQKGFKGVTMKDIVTETGLTKGAIYYYFESKKEVFKEVVYHFFSNDLFNPFENFEHKTLKDFYAQFVRDHFKQMEHFSKQSRYQSINRYSLIFDAIKYIPNFINHFNEHNEEELNVWETVIANAKKNGEINSKVPDKKLAKMFMFSGDGYALHFIMNNKSIDEMKTAIRELKSIWDELYALLKTE